MNNAEIQTSLLHKIRVWFICLIAGKMTIILNCNMAFDKIRKDSVYCITADVPEGMIANSDFRIGDGYELIITQYKVKP